MSAPVQSYTANGVALDYKRIGHNQVRIALPENVSERIKEEVRKAVSRFTGVTRAKYTREEALLLTVSTRKISVQLNDFIKSILNMIAAKISKSQRVRSANVSTTAVAKPNKGKRSKSRAVRRSRR